RRSFAWVDERRGGVGGGGGGRTAARSRQGGIGQSPHHAYPEHDVAASATASAGAEAEVSNDVRGEATAQRERGPYEAPCEQYTSFRFGLADDRTVVIHNTSFLAVAKPGDKCWTAVDLSDHLRPIMSFAGRFYGVTTHQRCHHGGGGQPGEPDAAAGGGRRDLTLQHRFSRMLGSAHLVDNNGELLLVHRTLSGDKRLYQAYRVDLDGRKTVPVRGLGGRAVFIGHDCSLSVSPATFPPSLVTPSTRASAVGIELAGSTSKPMITWQMEPLNTHSMKTAKRIGNTL
uniref:KIB1-4 beta-propeller domain-containing protein n=1 Tax=Oryza glaberrima TaxID=4538 RepID=I1QEK7_ORYGL